MTDASINMDFKPEGRWSWYRVIFDCENFKIDSLLKRFEILKTFHSLKRFVYLKGKIYNKTQLFIYAFIQERSPRTFPLIAISCCLTKD